MSILDIFRRKELITKQPRVPYLFNYGSNSPPERNLSGYLEAYSQIGWLFAVVSRIAEGVSEAKWRLYSVNSKGERNLIYSHPIIDLIDFVNPYQTWQEFIELHYIYMGLTGECFWIINKNRLGEPQETWIVPPEKMSVIPSKTDFIAGYVYQIGSEKIPLSKEEVIHHKLPNPLNPYRGLGPVQALAIDLDSEMYAGKWNRNFFYNSARPDGLIMFEGTLTEEQFERLKAQWSQKHEGYQKAHKIGLLEGGGKYQQIQFNAKDMDFKSLRLLNRDNILGAYGMPLSVMGITENVNKANAEAGEYTFARWLVKPRCTRLRGKLNEQFIPMFRNSKNLELDFDEVVPQTMEQKQSLAESALRSGYATINQARQLQGWDLLPPEIGDQILIPLNMIPTPVKSKSFRKAKSFDDTRKEHIWKAYVTKAEQYEKKLITELEKMFDEEENEVSGKLEDGERQDLLDKKKAKKRYIELALPVLALLIADAVIDAGNNIGFIPDMAESEALKWLKTRCEWAADEVGDGTSKLLTDSLAEGYQAGESMEKLAERVKTVFDNCTDVRAMRIARTETITASNVAATETYKEAGVKEVEWLTSLDGRECDECDDLNGNTFPVDDAPTPGADTHPNCRCVLLPVV